MNRRNFIRNSSLASLSVTAMSASATEKSSSAPLDAPIPPFSLEEITIDALQDKMQKGQLTAVALTKMYLQRIQALDKSGPMLNSVIELNPDALAIAAMLDAERKSGKVRGPMHGIPILIKDNISTGDKMMTTAGVMALVGNVMLQDAFIIKQLRASGAVLMGKTNLSEWANFRSTHSTSAWSSRGRQTKNPYYLDRNPSGSSSGSGVSVSANLCAIAIGTETNGSIISPSNSCGIVGLKPTVGLWSRSGIIPISATQDTAGPMARSVKDAAILLGALTGVDTADAVTGQSEGKTSKDYTVFCKIDALKGKRIGVEKQYFKGADAVVAQYKAAIEVLKSLGAEIVEIELLKLTQPLGAYSLQVLEYEFKDGVNKYLATANAKVKTLAEVIAFNKANEDKAMPFFKQELLEQCQEKGGLDSKEYIDAVQKTTSSRKIIDDLIKENRLDAICSTSGGPATCIDLVNGDYSSGFSFSSPAAWAGYPHITVPMGNVQGLPIGFSFMAGAYKEGEILGMAYAYEQASKKRLVPKFKTVVL